MQWFKRMSHLNGLIRKGQPKLWTERQMNGKQDAYTAPCLSSKQVQHNDNLKSLILKQKLKFICKKTFKE